MDNRQNKTKSKIFLPTAEESKDYIDNGSHDPVSKTENNISFGMKWEKGNIALWKGEGGSGLLPYIVLYLCNIDMNLWHDYISELVKLVLIYYMLLYVYLIMEEGCIKSISICTMEAGLPQTVTVGLTKT